MSDGRRRARRLVLGLALVAVAPVAWAGHDAVIAPGPSICAFRLVTGRDCVFCGLTRAFACVAHGEWSQATAYHPGWPFALALWLALLIATLADAVTGGDRLDRLTAPVRRHPWWTIAILAGITGVRVVVDAW